MTELLALLAVVLFVTLAGRAGALLLTSPDEGAIEGLALAPSLEASALRFMLGFGTVSLVLFGLVYFEWYTSWGLVIAVGVLTVLAFAGCLRGPRAALLSSLGRDLAVGLLLALLTLAFGWLQPAFDLTVAGSDGSVYLAAARQLESEGRLRYRDALVAEMTADERALLFERTADGRLPGGILLLDGASGRVSFSFYHLLPAWLALGLKALGDDGDLRVLSLFPVLSLFASFLIGRRLGGVGLAIALCLVQACFLPQAYFSRFPSSEILAQALFMSGLAWLMVPLGRGAPVRLTHATAAGVLWGALCLARVDSIPFLCAGLALAAFGLRRGGLGESVWLVLTAWVAACSLLAIHHQLSNGSYLYLPAMSLVAGLAGAAPGLAAATWGRIVALALAVALAVLSYLDERAPFPRMRLAGAARIGCTLLALAVLAFFASHWHWVAVARHLAWVSWYTTPGGLAVLGAGLAFGSLHWLRSTARPGARLGLLFLAAPAFCYLVQPMVTRTQPWAVRRFVPMVFPLFLLLSLLGCREFVAWLARGRQRIAAVAFGGLAVGIAATFYSLSARVVLPGVRVPVREQLRRLASTIPERALVLVSNEDAWLHLQTALQYTLRRDTLLLPLAGGSDVRSDLVVSSYLARQRAQGRRLVLVLAQDGTGAGSLLRSHALRLLGSGALEYVRLPYRREERFPPRMGLGRSAYRVYELRSVAEAPQWHEIRIGDVEQDTAVVMEGFHAPERAARDDGAEEGSPFRWSGPVARLALPPVEQAELVIDTWRPPSLPVARVEIDVDGILQARIVGTQQGRQCLSLRLPREPLAVNRIVTLKTNTFEMRRRDRPARARQLGVRVLAVSIDEPGTSVKAVRDESCAVRQGSLAARHTAGGRPSRGLGRAGERMQIIR